MGILLLFLLASGWGVRGSLFLHLMPQPVDSSTRELAFSPGGQIECFTPIQGLTLKARWRGFFHDSSRPWAPPSSQWTTATLSYRSPHLSMTLGRQFAFVGVGGLLDGAFLRFQQHRLFLEGLLGYRVDWFTSKGNQWFDSQGEQLMAIFFRYHFRPSSTLGIGIGRDADSSEIYQSPVWINFQTWGAWSGFFDLTYDLDQKAMTRIQISLSHFTQKYSFGLRYQWRTHGEIFKRLGFVEHEESPEGEEGENVMTEAFHRLTGSLTLRLPILVTLEGWVRASEDRSGQGVQIQATYRWFSGRAWLLGATEEGVQRGIGASVRYPIGHQLKAVLSGALATSPAWSESWIEHLRLGLQWSLPSGGTLHADFRILDNPLIELETRGYFFAEFPFEWRMTP